MRYSNLDQALPSYTGIIELRITPCGKLRFTFGRHVLIYETPIGIGEWYAHQFSLSDSRTELYKNYAAAAPERWDFSDGLTDRIYNRNCTDIWIGSSLGAMDWF